jgi:hypothetical protein
MIFEELCRRGLAKQSEDGASIPLHPLVRNLFLVLLGQILREGGPGLGLELSPATDSPKIQAALVQLLGLPTPQPSAGRVVTVDLELVGPNLEAVPLDEVVQFRAEHGAEFRAYARRLRAVVRGDGGRLIGRGRKRSRRSFGGDPRSRRGPKARTAQGDRGSRRDWPRYRRRSNKRRCGRTRRRHPFGALDSYGSRGPPT